MRNSVDTTAAAYVSCKTFPGRRIADGPPAANFRRNSATGSTYYTSRLALPFNSRYLGMLPSGDPGLFECLSMVAGELSVCRQSSVLSAVMLAVAAAAADQNRGFQTGTAQTGSPLNTGRAAELGMGSSKGGYDAAVLNADGGTFMTMLGLQHNHTSWTGRPVARKQFSPADLMLYLGGVRLRDEPKQDGKMLRKPYMQTSTALHHAACISIAPLLSQCRIATAAKRLRARNDTRLDLAAA